MKKTLVITDVTQMPQPERVCVVGVDAEGRSIRPICDGGFQKRYLTQNNELIIRPSAKVEFDLNNMEIHPPHIEDMAFNPSSIVKRGLCNDKEWEKVLQQTSFKIVEEIYEGYLRNKEWVLAGSKTRSIGTLSGVTIVDIKLTERSVKPRITFRDIGNHEYSRPVSDLTLWNYCYFKVIKKANNRLDTEKELIKSLQNVNRIYLRLGLARPWEQDNNCWLQVTGVYTFPDYLLGKTFADF
jgi:hypothetical protein